MNTTQRPAPTWEAPEGFHFEAVVDPQWTVGGEGRPCRHSTRERCLNRTVAILHRPRSVGLGWTTARYAYCAEHMFGRWVEGGKVMHWVLRKDEESTDGN